MHGIIHAELQKFVLDRFGAESWDEIVRDAGLWQTTYEADRVYPDSDAMSLVTAAARVTRTSPETFLEQLGEYTAPHLMSLYQAYIDPAWTTMDLLLNTEETIHRVVRSRTPGADPPALSFVQTGANTVKLTYRSRRKMSALAKGIIRGVAAHYHEAVTIVERKNADGSSDMVITIV